MGTTARGRDVPTSQRSARPPAAVSTPAGTVLLRALSPALALGIAASAVPAAAVDLWVDAGSAGCDDARPRAENGPDAPWCSLRPVESEPAAGDVVHVRDGTYRDDDGDGFVLQLRRSGAEGFPLVVRAERRWGARVVGDVATTTHCINTATGVHHVVFEGLEVTGCQTGFNVNNDNHHVELRRNWIHDIGRRVTDTTGGQSGISYGGGSTHLTVDGNLFHTIGRLPGSEHGENHDHGIYIRSTDVAITNNVFYDHVAGWAIHIYAPTVWKERIRIAFNTFAEPNPYRAGHILVYPLTRDLWIRDNLFLDPRDAPVNNHSCDDVENVRITGNLTTRDRMIQGEECGFEVADNRVGLADLGFLDAPGHDFRLAAGSVAVDAASDVVPVPAHDFDETPRPQGPGFDTGAFERLADVAADADADAGADAGPDADADADAEVDAGRDVAPGADADADGGPESDGESPGDAAADVAADVQEPESDDGGCGCRAAGTGVSAGTWVAVLFGAAALGRCRRRSPGRPRVR
ncbi:MAG: right-handed parallel beta-helix repeat-containing protein [Deltaproteobacteria bacterium]|nr:right-handed parallel beta-helix repeat-containing protein [Deltaproteobacteria bacterium]